MAGAFSSLAARVTIVSRVLVLLPLVAVLLLTGCLGPTLMPAEHVANKSYPDGSIRLLYDTDHDGRGDYAERQDTTGRVVVLEFDTDRDGTLDLDVALDQLADADCRQLLIILDSVPYQVVADLRAEGRFRLFYPPSHVISPYPVMTDLCLAEFFGVSPCQGLESRYYDGRFMTNGYLTYFWGINSPWLSHVDSYIPFIHHSGIYLWPYAGFDRELRACEKTFFSSDRRCTIGYSVGASALGSIHGRAGHEHLLRRVDRFCQSVMQRTRGRVRITLMSDHGHNLIESKPFVFYEQLAGLGYHETTRLVRPGDIVVPRFGPVTCAGVYTREPERVAADAVRLDAVELSFHRAGDVIVVHSHDGRAEVQRQDDKYRYECQNGDPLQLLPILADLQEQGRLDGDGYAGDREWFEATVEHVYPDPLYRLWRAFDGLLAHTPDVLVSIKDGYCFGNAFFNLFVDMESAHGSLRKSSSHGFVMSTAGPLPDYIRMAELRDALKGAGVDLNAR